MPTPLAPVPLESAPTRSAARQGALRAVAKSLAAHGLLLLALPANLALTGAALARLLVVTPPRRAAAEPRTILISGGKMTKALLLARSFHAAGHRVILVETAKYRMTGHRFSRAVDRFYTVPDPSSSGYAEALRDIVTGEGVDVYVPVCSPTASRYDAQAKALLSQYCEVLHGDPDTIDKVDDKYAFASVAGSMGLSVPDSHLVTTPADVEAFDFGTRTDPYILKSIPYDPVHRLDLTRLPRPTAADTAAFAASKPISTATPWIMQAYVGGQEYCAHSTVRDGHLQVYCCCASSPFQLNYEMVDKPEIEEWVTKFVGDLRLTGQYSFDFIQAEDGTLYAIECNPRTHSAITMFYDQPDLARGYLDTDVPVVRPTDTSRPTYWLYYELWRLLRHPRSWRVRLDTIRAGKDAIFDWSDPLPFLLVHHLQIPWLLAVNLLHGRDWIRVDFNIGKLVEPAGD